MLKHDDKVECEPLFYFITRSYLNLYLFLADVMLFRTNFFTVTFATIPLYLFTTSLI